MASTLTLEDIARISGVSRSTVSRVINNHPNVSENARRRVEEVIKSTGFQPNMAARSLASHKSHNIGLVIPRSVSTIFADPYFPRLILGVAQACNQYNYTLALFLFHTEEDERKLFPRISRPGLVDGTIIQSSTSDDEFYESLSQSDMPFVMIGRPWNPGNASYIDVDNVNGAYNAVRHLILLGYSRIGMITGPLTTTAGVDRFEGYKKALLDSGIVLDEALVCEGDYTEGSGYYSAQKLLGQKPEALFVASDMMAVGAVRAIREAGLSIPQDIAIVGYDDLPPARQVTPELTTVRQPIRRLGVQLVETLLDIIENGPLPPRRVVFGTELVIRGSCRKSETGAPRGKPS